MSRLRTRGKALWHAVFVGPDVLLATIRLQRSVTELAYLRDAMTRGIVDTAGLEREKLLLHKVYGLRGLAVMRRPAGGRTRPSVGAGRSTPRPRTHRPASRDRPVWVGTIPAPPIQAHPAAAPLGQTATQYSEVDPTWKPPGQ